MPPVPSALAAYVHDRRQGGLDIGATVDLLRRYAFLERAGIPALAGWWLQVPAYEDKIALGYHLWGRAERAQALRTRLQELRGGHRDANLEPALQKVGEALVHAPDQNRFLAGLRWSLQKLRAAYHEHVALADPAANAQDARVVRRLIPEIEADLAWYDARAEKLDPAEKTAAAAWTAYLDSLLAAAGGLNGRETRGDSAPNPAPEWFDRSRRLTFDERITDGQFENYDSRMDLTFEERRIAEFRIFFNEMYAAALVATILYDAWKTDAPWEFFYDLSHHFWDEVRHAEFGMVRLKELGAEPETINQTLFEQSQGLPFLHRICYLTLGLEVFYMPRKQPRVKRYGEAGDHRTQLFADVDWSEEGNHVRYGKRWTEYFLKDDARSIPDLQAEINEALAKFRENLPAGQLSPF